MNSLREIVEVWEVWVCDLYRERDIGGDVAGSLSGSKGNFEGKKKKKLILALKKVKNT